MQFKKHLSRVLLIACLCYSQWHLGQVDFNLTPNDDLGNYEDEFQEHFYEALKQKGIENYDRAVEQLLKCAALNAEESVVFFQLGKNYVQLKDFGAAETALKKAIALNESNEWYLDELYGVYLQIKDYDKALKTVKQLVKYHPDYKQDLATLYFEYGKYRLALKTLDELDEAYGVAKARDFLRNEIYNATGDDKERIEYLQERIAKFPNQEGNYLKLIFRYSEQGKKEKAFGVAKQLLKQQPESHLVHLALYKFYLEKGNPEAAIASMKIVTKSYKIKADSKAMVLNDFLKFVKENPQYEDDLLEVTTDIAKDPTGQSHAELAQYYLQKKNKPKALIHYLKALEHESGNFKIIKQVLLLQVDLDLHEDAVNLSTEALEIFPAQPVLYLVNGVANNHLNRPKAAIESLEMGVDYVIDNVIMEIDFYRQLGIAYKLDDNIAKSNAFIKKADTLIHKND
ncbi:MAG: hypothetical protein HRT67_13575 [Flavobacteriaceae bacterium]|nr:hypothetical protein [Flavobacteriaceae bacterium]